MSYLQKLGAKVARERLGDALELVGIMQDLIPTPKDDDLRRVRMESNKKLDKTFDEIHEWLVAIEDK